MNDNVVWSNHLQFSDAYKRIRVSYIEAVRVDSEEFEKRLRNQSVGYRVVREFNDEAQDGFAMVEMIKTASIYATI